MVQLMSHHAAERPAEQQIAVRVVVDDRRPHQIANQIASNLDKWQHLAVGDVREAERSMPVERPGASGPFDRSR